MKFPDGKRFAFSVFDDTDVSTLDYIRPVYDYLHELGMRTTKSVWCLDYHGESSYQGTDTLESLEYADYIKELQSKGFEIGYHGTTMESAVRSDIQHGLERYREILGESPMLHAAHSRNQDNLYWGDRRFGFGLTRWLYRLLSRDQRGYYQGHVEDSLYFWGDLARDHIQRVRSFTFLVPNLLTLKLPLVYQNPATPYVNSWYLTCDADNVEEFNALISPENQQRLEDEGGICIVSTHLGKGFTVDGGVQPETRRLLKLLSERSGWFAPVSEILDAYIDQWGCPEIRPSTLLRLELQWFYDSLKGRRSRRRYTTTETEYLARNIERDSRART